MNRLLTRYGAKLPLVFVLCFSTLALGGALVGQYGFGLHPCELCLYQRYPYAIIITLCSAALVAFRRSPRAQLYFAYACLALLLADAAIAAYHTGVELDIFQGPDACSATNTGEQTLEEMRAAIMGAPLVSCKQAMVYIFGFSMAAWNLIGASMAALVMLCMILRIRKDKP